MVAVGDYATGPRADHKNEQRLALTVQLAPRVHRLRMLGTAALDLAWVAEGRLDASITLANKPWDTAAGVLLAREAGATVVDIDGTAHGYDSAATIAGPDALITQLLPLIQATEVTETGSDSQSGFISPYAELDAILSQCPLPDLRLRRADLRPVRGDARRHRRAAMHAHARRRASGSTLTAATHSTCSPPRPGTAPTSARPWTPS